MIIFICVLHQVKQVKQKIGVRNITGFMSPKIVDFMWNKW